MNRVIHFEIEADDVERCKIFYRDIFGWEYEDYSEYVGSPYWGIVTGDEEEAGINGGLMKRTAERAPLGYAANSFVCVIIVDDYDLVEEKIIKAGGEVIVAKAALPGMAWQGYYLDTEGNTFGIYQSDENAK